MALASGCSESDSAAAASASTSVLAAAARAWSTAVTVGSPLVSVPVLSNSTAPTVRMLSSASRSLISTPPRAARSVAMDTTSGIARPSACGQAITSTVMVRTTASSGWPRTPHDDGGDDRRSQGEPEQPGRGPVGEPLRPRRRVLRLGHQPLDAGQRGVVADRGDLDTQPGVGGDGARDHRVAHAAAHRPGFAGHHRLVDLGGTVDDRAVGGHAAAGPHDHDVADPQVSRRDRLACRLR